MTSEFPSSNGNLTSEQPSCLRGPFYGPIIVPSRTEHAAESHLCSVFSISYEQMLGCHCTSVIFGRHGHRREQAVINKESKLQSGGRSAGVQLPTWILPRLHSTERHAGGKTGTPNANLLQF